MTNKDKEARNVRTIKRVWKALNAYDFDVFIESLTEDFVWASDGLLPFPGQIVGPKATKEWLIRLVTLLEGMQFELELIAPSDDLVTVAGLVHGTGTRGYMGLPPVSRPWQHQYCILYFFNEEGLMTKNWFFYDRANVLQQLGAIPDVSLFGLPPKIDWPPWPPHTASTSTKTLDSSYSTQVSSGYFLEVLAQIFQLPIRAMLAASEDPYPNTTRR